MPYTTKITDRSANKNHGTATNFADIAAAHVANANGTYGSTTFDSSSNYNHGTLNGSSSYATMHSSDVPSGLNASSLLFNGTDDYVSIPDIAAYAPGSAFSVEFWVKGSAATAKALFAQYDTGASQRSWRVGSIDTVGDKMRVLMSGDGLFTSQRKDYRGSQVMLDGTWHHVAITWSSGTLKLYVDGTEDSSVTKFHDDSFTSLHNSTANVTVAADLNSGTAGSFFSGRIKNARTYTSVLGAAEISSIAAGNAPTSTPALEVTSEYDQRIMTTGKALELDGVDDEIDVGDVSAADFGTGDFSVSAWVKTGNASSEAIISKIDFGVPGWILNKQAAGTARILIDDGGAGSWFVASTANIDDDAWHHVAGVVDRDASLNIYVDGVPTQDATPSHSGTLSNSDKLLIGDRNDLAWDFTGDIDDVRIYDKALSAAEITYLASTGQLGTDPTTTNLQGRWDFDNDFLGVRLVNGGLVSNPLTQGLLVG